MPSLPVTPSHPPTPKKSEGFWESEFGYVTSYSPRKLFPFEKRVGGEKTSKKLKDDHPSAPIPIPAPSSPLHHLYLCSVNQFSPGCQLETSHGDLTLSNHLWKTEIHRGKICESWYRMGDSARCMNTKPTMVQNWTQRTFRWECILG